MIRTIALACSLLALTGCDAINCVINNHPEFSENSIRSATLNQVFEQTINVSISNSYMDADYRYAIDLEGDLPPGISHEISSRDITFTGTPTELGEFPVRLSVVATEQPFTPIEDAPEELCSDTETRDMVFSVVQGS